MQQLIPQLVCQKFTMISFLINLFLERLLQIRTLCLISDIDITFWVWLRNDQFLLFLKTSNIKSFAVSLVNKFQKFIKIGVSVWEILIKVWRNLMAFHTKFAHTSHLNFSIAYFSAEVIIKVLLILSEIPRGFVRL